MLKRWHYRPGAISTTISNPGETHHPTNPEDTLGDRPLE